MKIKPGQENLEIQYTALSLVKSQQIRFRYRLDGLDPMDQRRRSANSLLFAHPCRHLYLPGDRSE